LLADEANQTRASRPCDDLNDDEDSAHESNDEDWDEDNDDLSVDNEDKDAATNHPYASNTEKQSRRKYQYVPPK
jgi:hypothetical protein